MRALTASKTTCARLVAPVARVWLLLLLGACADDPQPQRSVERGDPSPTTETETETETDARAPRGGGPTVANTKDASHSPDLDASRPDRGDASGAAARDAQGAASASPEARDASKDADAASEPVVAGACSGKRGEKRGKTNQTVTAGGMKRTFIMHAPKTLDPNRPVPVVIVPHGYTQAAADMYNFTNYPALADREGFVALFPDGQPGQAGPWNVGQGACNSVYGLLPLGSGDDQAFIDKMVETVESDQCVDREHIFVSGWSMGGFLSHETGCLRPEIRAIGPHSGGTHDLSKCPSQQKPVIMFHGTGDKLIPVECGKEARKRWAAHNGCSDQVEERPVRRGHCEYSKGCPANGQVVLCLFDEMNHGWAGGPNAQVAIYPSAFSEYESAAELGWRFFKDHAW